MFVNVVPLITIPTPLTYRLPLHLARVVKPGFLVIIPLRGQQVTGCVVQTRIEEPDMQVKDVVDVLSDAPALSPAMLDLTKWIAEYYISSLADAIKLAIPGGIERRSGKIIRRKRIGGSRQLHLDSLLPDELAFLKTITEKKCVFYSHVKKQFGEHTARRLLTALINKDLITVETRLLPPKIKKKIQTIVHYAGPEEIENILQKFEKRAPVQAKILRYLQQSGEIAKSQLLRNTNSSSQSISALVKRGLLRLEEREIERLYPLTYLSDFQKPASLTPEQQQAVDTILAAENRNTFSPFLLHGVTGSGKTQVYIECLQHILAKGKTALILVPEISLTAQAVMRYRTYFGDKVAFLHSQMSLGERYDAWRKIHEGYKQIVIGPRSAIFAPLTNIGLIVVDEEHDESYKQQETAPRYHARDVAVMLARLYCCPIILGSATPSLDSYYHASTRKYQLLELPNRIDDVALPKVQIVDLKRGKKYGGILSQRLIQKMQVHLEQGDQIMLLLNRRGYAAAVQCLECGYAEECTACSITLTYHRMDGKLKCHYCGHTREVPLICSQCGGRRLQFKGIAIQQVEEALMEVFPDVPVIRMDADTTIRKGAHGRIATAFESGKYRILLGTQMIAKGFDFPQVQLVGVLLADTGLHIPDFRGAERTFQLLTQVAGRAGRRKRRGEVVLQTFIPENDNIQYAVQHDYHRFFAEESVLRRKLLYPPFGRMAIMRFRGTDNHRVQAGARRFYELLTSNFQAGTVYEPVAAPVMRIKDQYRWQIVCKVRRREAKNMRGSIAAVLSSFAKERFADVYVGIDIDPVSTL